MRSNKVLVVTFLGLFLLTAPAFCADAQSGAASSEPDPMAVLQRMCDYLQSLSQFSFRAEATYDEVYSEGKKLQYEARLETYVKRPDKIRVDAVGDILDKEFFLNGGAITLYDKSKNVYADMRVPPNIEGALAKAHNEYNLRVSLTELANPHLWKMLSGRIQNALYVGKTEVRGLSCYHLAFDGPNVELQVWIDAGKKPLPMKVVFVQKKVEGEPQWSAYLSDWKTTAKLSDDLFTFSPPPGVQKIKFVPRKQPAAPESGKGNKS
ncbi:MAG: DUF2092 domain-containing protein [Syntrophobacteraceae bacterium]|nr:DUF2092 domain-containing protein [Syntrophobacteraceae bacterium]